MIYSAKIENLESIAMPLTLTWTVDLVCQERKKKFWIRSIDIYLLFCYRVCRQPPTKQGTKKDTWSIGGIELGALCPSVIVEICYMSSSCEAIQCNIIFESRLFVWFFRQGIKCCSSEAITGHYTILSFLFEVGK